MTLRTRRWCLVVGTGLCMADAAAATLSAAVCSEVLPTVTEHVSTPLGGNEGNQ